MFKRLSGAAFAALVALSVLAPAASAAAQEITGGYYQCVRFAREFSGIQIYGDAWTWWTSALTSNRRTGAAPQVGAVIVFQPSGRMTRGHVAVVSQILTERVLRISHANWGGSRGAIERDVTVVDVSDANDWSQVRVWHNPSGDLGVSVYPIYGFIYQDTVEGVQRVGMEAEGMRPIEGGGPQIMTVASLGAAASGQP